MTEITKIVTHAGCPDGYASARILSRHFPDAEILYMRHGSEELKSLEASPGMLFCDMTPPRERVEEFIAVDSVVLDHHVTARDITERFPTHLYSETRCGAELACDYLEVCRREGSVHSWTGGWVETHLARVIGIRDLWKRDDKDWDLACTYATALCHTGERFDSLLPTDIEISIAHKIIERSDERIACFVERHEYSLITAGGHVVAVFPARGLSISDAGHALISAGVADATAAYYDSTGLHGWRRNWSLRCRDGLDVSAVAAALGGGGHKTAAGFTEPLIETHICHANIATAMGNLGGSDE
jgi:oligoribonuclease NrnB/cAMP/cGMP phosphodiesterase (DHH superfamily)